MYIRTFSVGSSCPRHWWHSRRRHYQHDDHVTGCLVGGGYGGWVIPGILPLGMYWYGSGTLENSTR